jgi:cytochrome c-type biogenesis protein CcsB
MNSDQVFLGMISDPSKWQYEPLIKASHPEILDLLNTKSKYHSFSSFFTNQTYLLQDHVSRAFRKKPALRSRFDNEIIKLDEKVNICYLLLTGELLRIFPVPGDSTHTWYNPQAIINKLQTKDSLLTNNALLLYTQEVRSAMATGNWKPAEEVLNAISKYQQRISGDICPNERKISVEIFLNKSDIFSRISKLYGIIGFLLLVLHFMALYFRRLKLKIPLVTGLILIIILFCIHTAGLGLRWYVSGHAPWSNGYEALIYVAWAATLAGIVFSFKSSLTLGVGSILSFLILFVAHLSWMDPQITNLVPVLKSYWLILHVATITASYGFLAMGALLAFVNLLTMFLYTDENRLYSKYTILEITNTIEMALTLGLYLLTIGVFLGAVWANESWGRYWGWDPKETWALVTVIVYAFVLHMRMVPGLKGTYAFNLGSVLAFLSVIMTYFGVNYYLSGLHSYAKGDPLPVPAFVFYSLAAIIITAVIARKRSFKLALDENDTEAAKVVQ